MRRIVVNSLQRIGFTDIVEAGDGAEALEKVQRTPDGHAIDFVITNWSMPRVNGVDFTRTIRAHDATRALPVLMVAPRSVRNEIQSAIDVGVDTYVLKPFTPQVLREKIDAVLATRAA